MVRSLRLLLLWLVCSSAWAQPTVEDVTTWSYNATVLYHDNIQVYDENASFSQLSPDGSTP